MKIDEIANKLNQAIIEQLELGVVPWTCPWSMQYANGKDYAVNGVSKRPYTGCNFFLTNFIAAQKNENEFYTFNEVQKLGGRIKQGAKGCVIVCWINYATKTIDQDGVEVEVTNTEDPKFGLRYYYVYNRADIDGLPERKKVANATKELDFKPIEKAENIIKNYKKCPEIKHEGKQAFYSPAGDFVQMPPKKLFKKEEAYYSTLFHELVHSTGNVARLNRNFNGGFGSQNYSKEELVAELGASYLRGLCGIDTVTELQQSASYIDNWLKALKSDKKFFWEAANKAMKAVEFMTAK